MAGYDDLLVNLPLVCRLGSPEEKESLAAWLEVWTFIDEDGRARTLADNLWDGQQRFLEALLDDRHVVSIKPRKVGLTTLVCARRLGCSIRDVNTVLTLSALQPLDDAAALRPPRIHLGSERDHAGTPTPSAAVRPQIVEDLRRPLGDRPPSTYNAFIHCLVDIYSYDHPAHQTGAYASKQKYGRGVRRPPLARIHLV